MDKNESDPLLKKPMAGTSGFVISALIVLSILSAINLAGTITAFVITGGGVPTVYELLVRGLNTKADNGDLEIIPKCTLANLSLFSDKKIRIGNKRVLEFYIPCPQPLSTCEVATCIDNQCGVALATDAQCSNSAQCVSLYNNSLAYCGSSCQCVNGTTPTVTVPSYMWFTPASVTTSSGSITPEFSWYYYRFSAGVLEVMAYIDFSPVTSDTVTVSVNISNIGIAMASTGNYWGSKIASYTPNSISNGGPNIFIDVYSIDQNVIRTYITYSNHSLVGGDQYVSYYFVTNATQT